jgi:hypothetical protein
VYNLSVIPRIIWQTHEWEYQDLPYDYAMSSLTWQNINPDWEYRYVSAKDRISHIIEYDKNLLNFYQKCNKVTQSDIWRYVVLYLYGGVYSDMDSLCKMSLTNMIESLKIKKELICVPIFKDSSLVTGSYASVKKINIFKNLISTLFVEDKDYYRYGKEMHIGWEKISNFILQHKDQISFEFIGVIHGGHLENQYKYSRDFNVLVNNKHISYLDLAKTNNWNA